MVRKFLISLGMLCVVAFAIASSGGGASKKSTKSASGLSLVRGASGYSLKAGRSYSNVLTHKITSGISNENLVLTYRKGNMIYILPAAPRMAESRNNMDVIKLKLKLSK